MSTVEIKLHFNQCPHGPMWAFYGSSFEKFLDEEVNKQLVTNDMKEMFNITLPTDKSLHLFFDDNREYRKHLYLIMNKRKIYPLKGMDEVHLKYFLHEEGIDLTKL